MHYCLCAVVVVTWEVVLEMRVSHFKSNFHVDPYPYPIGREKSEVDLGVA